MNNFIESKRIIGSFSVVVVLTIVLAVGVFALLPAEEDRSNVSAQVVDVDEPPTNATEELDVKVDPTEPLPVNGTIIVDITDADDVDLNALPPEGVSVVVTNSTLTVTNHPVEISEEGAAAAATQPDITGLDTGNSTDSNNENDEEGSTDNEDTGGGSGSGEGDESTNTSDSSDDEEDDEE